MSKPPVVSVIMPAYNGIDYIAEAIASVLEQTYSDLELLIIDDGSTDGTAKLIENYADPRIKYVHQQNAGTSAARNHGLRLARGDYFGLLDQDDAWEPSKLERQIEFFEAHPEIGLVYTNARIVDALGKFIRPYTKDEERGLPARELLFNLLARRNFICPATLLCRRSIIDAGFEFDASVCSVEDYDFLVRILQRFKAGYIDEMLVNYRLHDANFSRHMRLRHMGTLRILERYGAPLADHPHWASHLRRRITDEQYALGYSCFEEDRMAEARTQFNRSLGGSWVAHPALYLYWTSSFLPLAAIRKIRAAKRWLSRRGAKK